MKKLKISLFVLAALTTLVVITGCARLVPETQVQLTDPNSLTQQAAQAVQAVVGVATPIVASIQFPGSQIVLTILSLLGVIAAAIQTYSKGKTQKALTEVVYGVEQAKKASPDVATQIKTSQLATQSIETTKMVSAIRDEL